MSRAGAFAGIDRFALFGDAPLDADPEFVHIENIRARALLHGWRITPHAHPRMFQIIYLIKGRSAVWIDRETTSISAPCLVFIPGGVVHGFTFEPDAIGWVLTISEMLQDSADGERSRKFYAPLFTEPAILHPASGGDNADEMASTFERMHREFKQSRLGRSLMLEWLMRIILMNIRRELDTQIRPPTSISERRELYARFRQLLEEHYRKHWTVSDYAHALALSEPRLNRLTRTFYGKSASALAQDRLALEAQRHLIYTSASAAMIAYDLGFQDPAYFSRFFKRRTGMTPGAFRAAKLNVRFPAGDAWAPATKSSDPDGRRRQN